MRHHVSSPKLLDGFMCNMVFGHIRPTYCPKTLREHRRHSTSATALTHSIVPHPSGRWKLCAY